MTQDTFNNNDATDERVIISYSYSHPNQPEKYNKTTTNNKSKKTQKPTQKHRYSIKKAISALEPENKQAALERFAILQQVMQHRHSESTVRDDSRLAGAYVTNQLPTSAWPVERVADEIAAVKKVFDTSDYDAVTRQMVRSIARDLHMSYGVPLGVATKQVLRNVLPVVKNMYVQYAERSANVNGY